MRERFEEILSRFLDYQASMIDTTISEKDDMFDYGLERYLTVGLSAIHVLSHAMMLTGLTKFHHVLDLPCGFGRVLRHLVKFLPDSKIFACDLNREAVDFCRKTFKVEGIYSKDKFDDIHFDSTFDLIWCGSLLTHLKEDRFREAINLFVRSLSDGGIAIVTLIGRFAKTVQEKYHKLLPDERFAEAMQGFLDRGFGFKEYEGYKDYGISLSSPSFVLSILEKIPEIQVCCYSEREWTGFHDVLIFTKRPISKGF